MKLRRRRILWRIHPATARSFRMRGAKELPAEVLMDFCREGLAGSEIGVFQKMRVIVGHGRRKRWQPMFTEQFIAEIFLIISA